MSRLEKLLAKPIQITIEGEVFDIHPLTVENIDLIFDLEQEEKKAEAFKNIIKVTLKKAVPDATDGEINGICMSHFEILSNAILSVNGVTDDKSAAIKDKIAQQRALK